MGHHGCVMDRRIDVPLPFPRDGAVRRVMRENVVQLSGFRALMLQALSPAMTAGFLEHTDMFDSPAHTWRRLWRTRLAMNRIYFGEDADEIQAMLAGIRAGHEHVKGELPEAIGRFAAGTPYAASDPDNLLWTLTITADSAWTFYATFVGGSRALRDEFWSEYRIVGRLFGLAEDEMPTTWPGVKRYIASKTNDGSLALVERAREVALRNLLSPPFPLMLAPAEPFVGFSTVALLPPWARPAYGLRWPRALALPWLAAVAQFRATYALAPAKVRYAPEWAGEFPELPPYGGEPEPVGRLPIPLAVGLRPQRAAMRLIAGGQPRAVVAA